MFLKLLKNVCYTGSWGGCCSNARYENKQAPRGEGRLFAENTHFIRSQGKSFILLFVPICRCCVDNSIDGTCYSLAVGGVGASAECVSYVGTCNDSCIHFR